MYIGATNSIKEAIWLRKLFKDIGFLQDNLCLSSMTTKVAFLFQKILYSMLVLSILKFNITMFVRRSNENGDMDLVFCGTYNMVANVLSKV